MQLLRRLGLVSATALVVSNMIGTGIFTTTGFLARDLGTPRLVLLSWIVGAACALLGAVCYSELALNFPASGGEYLYLSRAYGPTWGFISGWVSLIAGFSAPIAAAALSCASYFAFVFRGGDGGTEFPTNSGAGLREAIACGLVALLSVCNLIGIKAGARLQNVLTGLKLAMLLAFVSGAIVAGHGDWQNLFRTTARSDSTPIWEQFAVSLFWIYVSYSGWNAATYVAEEIENPEYTLPRALLLGTGMVAVLYLALNVVFIYATPLAAMKGVIAVGAQASSHLFGPQTAGAFSALMGCALLSTVNAMIIAGPRVYYAMARDGQFLRFAGTVHARWRTPANSILVQGVCAMLLVLTPFPQLVVYIGFTLNLFAVLSVGALFRFRRRAGWKKLRAVSFGYPLVPALFVVVGLWMTVEGFLQRPFISIATVCTIAAGGLFYRMQAHRSQTSFEPPVDTPHTN